MPHGHIIKVERRKKRKSLPLDLVPLIDIVFLLLIFFMLTATFTIQSGIKVKLPKATTPGEEIEKRLTIYLTAGNVLYLNQERVELNNLRAKLKSLAGGERRNALIIKADENARHGMVVKIMDMATAAGIDKLMIAAEKEEN